MEREGEREKGRCVREGFCPHVPDDSCLYTYILCQSSNAALWKEICSVCSFVSSSRPTCRFHELSLKLGDGAIWSAGRQSVAGGNGLIIDGLVDGLVDGLMDG